MGTEQRDYEILPIVLESGKNSRIRIRPLGRHAAFAEDADYLVRFLPMDESAEPAGEDAYPGVQVKPEGGCLRFEHVFEGEQEYYIRVFRLPERAVVGTFSVYAVEEDLYLRNPYRGDFHTHTFRSDGAQDPAVVAANYRKSGFDFTTITDHHKWAPSEEAIRDYRGVPIDLKIFHGEEVHGFDNHIHMINFGGEYSVNELFEKDRERYFSEVRGIEAGLSVPEDVNAFEVASCVWITRRIREAHGLSIFCHPFWIADVYHVPLRMVDFLFRIWPFDAFELIGGHEAESNNLQTAYYSQARSRGRTVPVVGSSDAHSDTVYFNWFSTIVFAEKMDVASVSGAVKDLYSVAVEQYPGEFPRVYGPYRMVKFALFLLRAYFPAHAGLCFEEGRLMKEFACGDGPAAEALGRLRGRTEAFLKRCYGRA